MSRGWAARPWVDASALAPPQTMTAGGVRVVALRDSSDMLRRFGVRQGKCRGCGVLYVAGHGHERLCARCTSAGSAPITPPAIELAEDQSGAPAEVLTDGDWSKSDPFDTAFGNFSRLRGD